MIHHGCQARSWAKLLDQGGFEHVNDLANALRLPRRIQEAKIEWQVQFIEVGPVVAGPHLRVKRHLADEHAWSLCTVVIEQVAQFTKDRMHVGMPVVIQENCSCES